MCFDYKAVTGLIFIGIGFLLPAYAPPAKGEVITGTDEEAQLPFWEWRNDVMSVRLVQRLPDQTRAFFTARGFTKSQAEVIAQGCIFQTVYKNIATPSKPGVIEYDLTQWKVLYQGDVRALKVKEAWQQEWEKAKVPQPAQIAFFWALIPTQQRFEPQDYNWGMTSYNLVPGEKFDLEMVWRQDGVKQSGAIRGIECAPDVELEPRNPFG